MAKEDSLQSISVKLDGKNYSYWSYVRRNFLKGKRMWSYISGNSVKPSDLTDAKYMENLETWEVDNSKIITWINNSVEHSIDIQLAKYENAKEVWDHLAKLFTQANFAMEYQLESQVREVVQGTMSIQEFYSVMSGIWDQLALTESAELQAFPPYIARQESQRLVQFLLALRPDFEGIRGSILYRNPCPSVDCIVSELLAEEVRLKSKAGKNSLPVLTPSVMAEPFRPPRSQNRQNWRVGSDECSFCKQPGHWKVDCPILLNRAKQQSSVPSHPVVTQ